MPVRPHRGEGVAPVAHGAVNDRELAALGLRWSDVVDFSVNSNPFGPPPAVHEALRQVDISRYPDPEALALREIIAEREGLSLDHVLVANGSAEVLLLAGLAFLNPGDWTMIIAPTFGEYQRVSRAARAHLQPVITRPPDFSWSVAEVCRQVAKRRPRILFLCNPNNPTGAYLPPSHIQELLAASPDTLLVLDEAYLSFVEGGQSCAGLLQSDLYRGVLPWSNLLIVRSMTKDYALAGLRLGYALGPTPVIAAMQGIQPPWNVNAMALAAGQAALDSAADFGPTRRELQTAKAYLTKVLTDLGLEVVPSAAHFFLVRVGDATAFRSALLRQGCVVRECTSFGLPEYVRIGTRTMPECQRLVAAVQTVLADNPALQPAAKTR